jgi:hypothetical protein
MVNKIPIISLSWFVAATHPFNEIGESMLFVFNQIMIRDVIDIEFILRSELPRAHARGIL